MRSFDILPLILCTFKLITIQYEFSLLSWIYHLVWYQNHNEDNLDFYLKVII